ncbi:M48 family metallopeptidase [Rickettsiales bacterium]|nr:M48 family metallopeptidase [Rickettsiales bacterium]
MHAIYYNGINAGSFNVSLKFTATKCIIQNSDATILAEWNLDDVKIITRPISGQEAILTNKIGKEARLILAEKDFNQIVKFLPKSSLIFQIPNSLIFLLAAFVVAILVLFYIYKAIPRYASTLAPMLPETIEQKLGSWVNQSLISQYDLCENKEAMTALLKIVNNLEVAANLDQSLKVSVIEVKEANAFAASGGYIILTSNLIESAKTEGEIAGVIAHEISHVKLYHPTQSLIRSLGSYVILNLIFGNTGAEELALILNSIEQFQYSQEMELDADLMSITILENANYSSEGLVTFFNKIDTKDDINENYHSFFQYFSTHPMTKDRIELINNNSSNKENYNQLSIQEWQSLQKICN